MQLCIKSCNLLSIISENYGSHDKMFKMGILKVK